MRQLLTLICLGQFVCAIGCTPTVGVGIHGISNFSPTTKPTDVIYRGAQPDQSGIKTLADMGVKSVINLRDDPVSWEEATVKSTKLNDGSSETMKYDNIPVNCGDVKDAAKIDADIRRFLNDVQTMPKPIFVHCQAGQDRTGMFVAIYRQVDESPNDPDIAAKSMREMRAYGHGFWPICLELDDFLKHRFHAADYKHQ